MGSLDLMKGVIFCTLWYLSILFGFVALYCPLLPLVFINSYVFRLLTDKIFAFWELYPTALLQLLCGTKIYVHGDYVDTGETSLIVMNHRTRVDWNYVWLCMFHATRNTKQHQHGTHHHGSYDGLQNGGHVYQNGGYSVNWSVCNGKAKNHEKKSSTWNPLSAFNQKTRIKYVLKDEIRHIPGPGWVMQLNCFMYIRRCWETDEAELRNVARYLQDLDYTYQLLLFPEGTDLSESNIRKSDSFAKKNNFPIYRQVLHPRTRGFCHLAKSMSPQLAAVYDITVGYAGDSPCQLRDFAAGRFPPEVHFSIKRYPVNLLPEGETSLADWLNERWKNKEEHLKDFYKHGRFVDASNRLEYLPRGELILAFIFWTCLVVGCPVVLVISPLLRLCTLVSTGLFLLMAVSFKGFHHLEMRSFRVRNHLADLLSFKTKVK